MYHEFYQFLLSAKQSINGFYVVYAVICFILLNQPVPLSGQRNKRNPELSFEKSITGRTYLVDNKHYIKVSHDNTRIIKAESGETINIFEHSSSEYFNYRRFYDPRSISQNYNNIDDNGWITYAYCAIGGLNPPTIKEFRAKWIVPSPPIEKSNQLIYLFISLMTIEDGKGHIIQPVLQWGISPAGGGQFWSICNWYVTSDNLFFHDPLIKVNPGDRIDATLSLVSNNNGSFNYVSSFKGDFPESSLRIDNLPELMNPSVVLESYNVTACNEYPLDEKIRFTSIGIETESEIVEGYTWNPYIGLTSCNQTTKIVDESLNNGQVDIHFHTPSFVDDKIHLYPNPIGDYLHVSFVEPVLSCLIKVYDNLGKLIYEQFYNTIDFEFNIEFHKFSPGIYFVNFDFLEDKHRNGYLKMNHTYKIIKKGD